MRNLLTILVFSLLVINQNVNAQIKTPASSSPAKFETTVGLTTINLEYSRPSKNDRVIFGDLVPYNTMWRTGANKNSMITFSDDVMIGGNEVKKGTYAIFAKPSTSAWEVNFYGNTENWGVPENWDEALVAAKVMVTPSKTATVTETFTLNIGNVTNNSCHLELAWDNLLLPIKIDVPTDKKVNANIDQVMAGPTAGDYYNAARYYRESKKDLNKALEWMNKSIEMGNNKFWILRQKSLIEADMKNYRSAIETAKVSLEMSKEAKNNDYVKMNEDSIASWSKMLK
jgi:hypothetical protein